MKGKIFATIALGTMLGISGLALAQPAYGPNATYYPGYTPAAPPPAVTVPPPVYYGQPAWDGTHSNGGAARAYSYWGAQKSN